MAESDEVLVVTMAYCLTWEIAGARASQCWQGIRDYIQGCKELSETECWICELYEESSPTAQEERSLLSRINARLEHPRIVVNFRRSILELLPDSLRETAVNHRLMNSLIVPKGYSRLRIWLAKYKIARLRPTVPELAPLAEREADFLQFMQHPCFTQGFRQFWHQAPKYRNNRKVRVLLCVAAALSQMLVRVETTELQQWSARLGKVGSYTEQTRQDVATLTMAMSGASYDAQELAYRLVVDAKDVDRENIMTFCHCYADRLSDFAQDLVAGMQIIS